MTERIPDDLEHILAKNPNIINQQIEMDIKTRGIGYVMLSDLEWQLTDRVAKMYTDRLAEKMNRPALRGVNFPQIVTSAFRLASRANEVASGRKTPSPLIVSGVFDEQVPGIDHFTVDLFTPRIFTDYTKYHPLVTSLARRLPSYLPDHEGSYRNYPQYWQQATQLGFFALETTRQSLIMHEAVEKLDEDLAALLSQGEGND